FNEEYPDGWEGFSVKGLEEIGKYWGVLMGNPAETRSQAELFRKVLKNHIIEKGKHKDGIPDLAYLTIKATDAVAHQFGSESLEAKETFREADKQVGLLFDFLQKEYGDKFIMVVTADHGGIPMPEISGGERYTIKELIHEVNSLLPESSQKTESLIKFMAIAQISLDHDVMTKHSITEEMIIRKILSIQVNGKPFFKNVHRKSELN
ncbi:MAG TPA: alkaline phosphatase family protein, partial [Leptospiraceae bacterium]|nr:alkaline phosphatase family protein [Leptospiraceae bacterium]